MRGAPGRLGCCFDASGGSIRTSGPWTKTLGPVRAYGMPFWRASTQTRQAQPGRGIVTAPPEPRISTLKCSDADRVPDGLQLEERRDLVEALRVGRAED